MEENGITIEEGWDRWRIILTGLLSSYKTQRKSFLKVMMWCRVLIMINIKLMLRNNPLISLLLEDLIRDGPQGVFNSPRST